jgi:predicted transcriptional regulator
LLAALKGSKKGLSLSDVIKKVGAPRTAVKYHLRALRSRRKARVAGTRQLARWFASK